MQNLTCLVHTQQLPPSKLMQAWNYISRWLHVVFTSYSNVPWQKLCSSGRLLPQRTLGLNIKWSCCRTDPTNSHGCHIGVIEGGKLNNHRNLLIFNPWLYGSWRNLAEILRQLATGPSYEPHEVGLFTVITKRNITILRIMKLVYWIAMHVVCTIVYCRPWSKF